MKNIVEPISMKCSVMGSASTKDALALPLFDQAAQERHEDRQLAEGLGVEMAAAVGQLAQHHQRQRRLVGEMGGQGLDPARDLLLGGCLGLGHLAHAGRKTVDAIVDDVLVQPELAAEVVVEQRLVHPGLARQRLDASGGKAVRGEFLASNAEDQLTFDG